MCAKFLERFVFPDFCTFRFSNRAHFVLPDLIKEIIFTATIYKAEERRQNFGQVRNSYIRIYDAKNNTEIARYDLDEDFSIETAVEFGRLYRHNGEWKFEAIGNGNKGGLQALVNKYAKQFA